MARPSMQEWLFGRSFEGAEDVFRFQEFLQNVGRAFLYHELPPYVPASREVKDALRRWGIKCRVPALLSLFLGAVRVYEESHRFLQPKFPPTRIFRPFGISDEDIRDYVGLRGVVFSVAKTSKHSSIDGIVDVQRIFTSQCQGSVTFRRREPCHLPIPLLETQLLSGRGRIPGIGLRQLPRRVTYRNEELSQMVSRGLSSSEVGVLFRVLLRVATELLHQNEDSICGIDIVEEFPVSFDVSRLLEKASGCVFLINPKSGFITVEHCGEGEDFLLFVDTSS